MSGLRWWLVWAVTCLWYRHDWEFLQHDNYAGSKLVSRVFTRRCRRCGRYEFEHADGVWEFL